MDEQCLHVQSSFFAEPLRNADLFSNFAGFTVDIAHKTPFFACFYAYMTKNYAVCKTVILCRLSRYVSTICATNILCKIRYLADLAQVPLVRPLSYFEFGS